MSKLRILDDTDIMCGIITHSVCSKRYIYHPFKKLGDSSLISQTLTKKFGKTPDIAASVHYRMPGFLADCDCAIQSQIGIYLTKSDKWNIATCFLGLSDDYCVTSLEDADDGPATDDELTEADKYNIYTVHYANIRLLRRLLDEWATLSDTALPDLWALHLIAIESGATTLVPRVWRSTRELLSTGDGYSPTLLLYADLANDTPDKSTGPFTKEELTHDLTGADNHLIGYSLITDDDEMLKKEPTYEEGAPVISDAPSLGDLLKNSHRF